MTSPWDALYAAPFSEFVAERKRLASELKRAGEAAEAKAMAAATKPSLSAWVVNQLWRRHHQPMKKLFSLSGEVRTAKNATKLRAATEELRTAVAALREPAAEILKGDGHADSDTTWRRVSTTLSALAAIGSFEPDEPGRLTTDRDPPGFGTMEGLELELPPPPARPPAPKKEEGKKEASEKEASKKEASKKAKKPAVDHARIKALALAKHALEVARRARERAEKDLERAKEAEQAAEREVSKYGPIDGE